MNLLMILLDEYYFKYNLEQPDFNVISQHWEERKGGLIRGGYSLLQPDNRIRSVDYKVDGEKGFTAVVQYRKPPGNFLRGHLHFPNKEYNGPLWLVKPVGFITPDLLYGKRSYPNLPT